MNRLAYVDGLRGIFAIAVAIMHLNKTLIVPGAYLAVDFFFVLSGFILTLVYLPRVNNMTLGDFAFARLSRLWPLHVFTMLLYVTIYTLAVYLEKDILRFHPDWKGNDFRTFVENVFLIQSIGLQDTLTWNYPSWSISVEFFVNMALFLVLGGLLVRETKAKTLVLIGGVIAFCMVVLNHNLSYLGSQKAIVTQWAFVLNAGLLRGFAGIFLGVFVALIVKFWDGRSELRLSPFTLVVKSTLEIALLGTLFFIIMFKYKTELDFIAIYLFGTLLVLLSVGRISPLRWVLSLKPLTFLGMISYGVYLGHAPLLQFFKRWDKIIGEGWGEWAIAGVFICAVIATATLLHYFVELPAQRACRRFWKEAKEKRKSASTQISETNAR